MMERTGTSGRPHPVRDIIEWTTSTWSAARQNRAGLA
jgi:hypothetical protein